MLTLKNLTASIGNKEILHNINLVFESGKTYVLMGPNGSGKSTLANAIMGNPLIKYSAQSKITLNAKNITKLSVDKRARQGIFMSFQTPPSLSGITIYELVQAAQQGTQSFSSIKSKIDKYASDLHISDNLLTRPINDGFSGGERKKMELLQAAVLDPEILIFDEIDTGVDLDALKTIISFMKKFSQKRTSIIISHNPKMLRELEPDYVIILCNGRVSKIGDRSLVKEIEDKGFNNETAGL